MKKKTKSPPRSKKTGRFLKRKASRKQRSRK